MVNEEGKVSQGCEAIVIEESIEMYAWILKEMNRLEPRFHLNKIRYIFSDQKVTNSLLIQLGIEKSCTLRCDCWHMMNEVWPKQINFGNQFNFIKKFYKQCYIQDHKMNGMMLFIMQDV